VSVLDIRLDAASHPRRALPRRREHVLHASVLLLEHLRAAQARALARIGRPLSGPLPAPEREPDPPTGLGQRGAS
jgi:1-acyl-sn-glycerol-3-phosphate acyltransferase